MKRTLFYDLCVIYWELNGKKVEDGFYYSSGNNTEWLSVEDIMALLKEMEFEK